MFSNLEIQIRNECRRKGLDPDEILQLMQVPYEWGEDSYLFDFNSLPVEKLSNYVDYIFRKQGYGLDKGTQINGVYFKNRLVIRWLISVYQLNMSIKLKYAQMKKKHV